MSAERNSSLAVVLCLAVEFELEKSFKEIGENVGLWNVFVSMFTQHTKNVYVYSVS